MILLGAQIVSIMMLTAKHVKIKLHVVYAMLAIC